MIINDRARQIVMDSESLRLEAYKCPAGRWTVGYGHTGDVKEGDRITRHQAEAILEYDLSTFEEGVRKLAPQSNGNQFSAMVSLAFNIGLGAFAKSTLLKEHLAGRHLNAAVEFGKWTYGGGQKLPGLVTRRAQEAALYLEAIQ